MDQKDLNDWTKQKPKEITKMAKVNANKSKTKNNNSKGAIGFENKLWEAADKMRNNMDPAEYKHVVLGLIFLKYISDAFEEKYDQLESERHADLEDPDEYLAENIFWVPKEARWTLIKDNSKDTRIGIIVDDAMGAIEKSNNSLKGVLPKIYGSPDLNKIMLGGIIDLISDIALGFPPATSIFIARECRKRAIPMVESWGVPFLFTWWFTRDSVDYENCYGLETYHYSYSELANTKEKINLATHQALLPKVFTMPGVREKYDREPGAFEEVMNGSIGARSFAPFVRITADFLSVDIIFSGILGIKPKNLAPNLKGFDYINMEVKEAVLTH